MRTIQERVDAKYLNQGISRSSRLIALLFALAQSQVGITLLFFWKSATLWSSKDFFSGQLNCARKPVISIRLKGL